MASYPGIPSEVTFLAMRGTVPIGELEEDRVGQKEARRSVVGMHWQRPTRLAGVLSVSVGCTKPLLSRKRDLVEAVYCLG